MAWISFDSSADNAVLNIQLFKVEVKFHKVQRCKYSSPSTCIACHDYRNDQNGVLTDSVKSYDTIRSARSPQFSSSPLNQSQPSTRSAGQWTARGPTRQYGVWLVQFTSRPTTTRRSVSRPTFAVPQLYCNHNPQSLLFPEPWSLLLCSYQSLGSVKLSCPLWGTGELLNDNIMNYQLDHLKSNIGIYLGT